MKIKIKLIDGVKGTQSFIVCNSKKVYKKFTIEADMLYTLTEEESDTVLLKNLKNYETKIPYSSSLEKKLKENGVDIGKLEVCESCGGRKFIRIKPLEVWTDEV